MVGGIPDQLQVAQVKLCASRGIDAARVKVGSFTDLNARICSDKIDRPRGRLADLRRTEVKDRDCLIFSGIYALGW